MTALSLLRAHGLKATPQRLALFEAVAATRSHPTAEEVFGAVRSRHPAISRNTVYTGLEALVVAGLLRKIHADGGHYRYDATLAPHLHTVCEACGQIADLEGSCGDRLVELARGASATADFDLRDQDLYMYGTCAACRAQKGP